jgi:hypothetical protein
VLRCQSEYEQYHTVNNSSVVSSLSRTYRVLYELPFTRNEGLVPGTVQQYSTVYVQCRTVQNKVSFAGGASFVGGEISLLYEIGTVQYSSTVQCTYSVVQYKIRFLSLGVRHLWEGRFRYCTRLVQYDVLYYSVCFSRSVLTWIRFVRKLRSPIVRSLRANFDLR